MVGAGPTGLAVASGLGRRSVLVLESGDVAGRPGVADLVAGENLGDAYDGASAGRSRGLGGTANLWNTPLPDGAMGAKYLPLDASDLDQWTGRGLPYGPDDLAPYYRQAQALCGLGPFNYEAGNWPPHQPDMLGHFAPGIYQLGAAAVFARSVPTRLAAEGRVRIATGATVVGFEWAPGGRAIDAVRIATRDGAAHSLRVGSVALAAGGIENPRLLLATLAESRSPWLGRGLMEHPRDYSMVLEPRPGALERLRFFDRWKASDGTVGIGRLGLGPESRSELDLPNASISLLPRPAPSLRNQLLRAVPRSRQRWMGGYGWSETRSETNRVGPIGIVVNLEQRPHRENRVVLSGRRDRLGMPLPAIDWRWREDEQQGLDRLRSVVAAELEACGLGRVRFQPGLRPDPNAFHPAGTTRMALDPTDGVVDPDGRVHGTDNLYVTGASTFPIAGFANPTLTAVALALRLASHLTHR